MSLPAGRDMASNDYLGMAAHPDLRAAAIEFLQGGGAVGSGGSRLLRGHTQVHAALEDFAADYFSAPKALYFSSGFQANSAIFQTLCGRHDVIVFDAYVHASAREGIQNSSARHIRAAHSDIDSFEAALKDAQAQCGSRGRIWIAVESVYSMDGDIAPLDALYALAEAYDAVLVIDEAHGTGVLGREGKGVSEGLIAAHGYERIVTLHTCGKAIGVAGGLVCASEEVVDMLVNCARGFIYSTAPMPLQAHLVQKSLEIMASEEGQAWREKLTRLCEKAQGLFSGAGTHIVPIVIGDDEEALRVAELLRQRGWDIRAVRPPTVPEGTARLRLSLSAALDEGALEGFAADLGALMRERAA
ncbi:MAG: 8-amino-7-oxononanoate synthase [Alphaproteobacteria bacterium]